MFKVIHGQSPMTRSFIRYIIILSETVKFSHKILIRISELQGGIFGKNC